MSSIVDSSTTLEVMKSANDDFVELILKLKALFNGKEPVTFNMGQYSITVNTILELISNYKDGKFDSVLLGGQTTGGKQVKLSVDANGNLCVTDGNGSAVSVSCSKLVSSLIESCIAKQVVVEGATIRSIKGKVSVSGGNFSFGSMRFDSLDATTLKARNLRVENLSVNSSLACEGLTILGARQLRPKTSRNMFYRDGNAINKAASRVDVLGSPGSWEWDIDDNDRDLTPADVGFSLVTATSPISGMRSVPDMIRFWGNTKFDDFKYKTWLLSSYAALSAPTNLAVWVNLPNTTTNYPVFNISNRDELLFAALLAFPTGGYAVGGSDNNGVWYLTSFDLSDIGKEIYYQTLDTEWKIYRTLKVTCQTSAQIPTSVEFGDMVTIPPYSCARFIVNCFDKGSSDDSSVAREVIYALEIT